MAETQVSTAYVAPEYDRSRPIDERLMHRLRLLQPHSNPDCQLLLDAAGAVQSQPYLLGACKMVLESLERNLASDYLPETRDLLRRVIERAENEGIQPDYAACQPEEEPLPPPLPLPLHVIEGELDYLDTLRNCGLALLVGSALCLGMAGLTGCQSSAGRVLRIEANATEGKPAVAQASYTVTWSE